MHEILHAPGPLPTEPVNDYNNPVFTDPQVPFGQSFVNAPFNPYAEPYRVESMRGWWLRLLLASEQYSRKNDSFLAQSRSCPIFNDISG